MPLDIVDQAQDRTEELLQKSLNQRRKTLTIPFSGKCLGCDEPVVQKRYCCPECREFHEDQLRKKAPYR